jgi:hypothetical protein
MVHFSVFGGHEGQLDPNRGVYISVFGGATLRRPPFASQVIEWRRQPALAQSAWRYLFFNVFGGADLVWPTLAEEYVALREALRTGTLTLADWDELAARPEGNGPLRVSSLTVFGGFDGDALPREDRELDDLALQRHLGHIPDQAVDSLVLTIGQRGVQRLAAVRRAVAGVLSAGA